MKRNINLVSLFLVILCLRTPLSLQADPPQFAAPELDTSFLGGIETVSADDLVAMQRGQYVLHARNRELKKVPVEKTTLPRDPGTHSQHISLAKGPDDACYVMQPSILSKSTDGGRTWITYGHNHPMNVREKRGLFNILKNGSFISVIIPDSMISRQMAQVWRSNDEGRTWNQTSEFKITLPEEMGKAHPMGNPLQLLPDGALIYSLGYSTEQVFEGKPHKSKMVSGGWGMMMYRSEDDGNTWQGPYKVCDWGCEGAVAFFDAKKLLAAIRYQRLLNVKDPGDIFEQTGAPDNEFLVYKHLFLADSIDGGKTWHNLRRLTNFGQPHGFPVALQDGTVVIVHDHRVKPGVPCGHAMISRDQGKTWEDEVYFMFYGKGVSSYSMNVTLKDDTILTVAGTSDYPLAGIEWSASIGYTDLTAIRWKPVK